LTEKGILATSTNLSDRHTGVESFTKPRFQANWSNNAAITGSAMNRNYPTVDDVTISSNAVG
jgi:hypothetical protein